MRLLRLSLLSMGWSFASSTHWQQTSLHVQHQFHNYQSGQQPEQGQYSLLASSAVGQPATSVGQVIPQDHSNEQDNDLPSMNLEHVSLSLRLTCEMNRRLLQGIRNYNSNVQTTTAAHHTKHPLLQRGGDDTGLVTPQHHPVNIHPSQSWQPPIRQSSNQEQQQEEETLTMFHAKAPRTKKTQQRRGVARWGPELLPYLEYLVNNVLHVPQNQQSLTLALALMYLDRACSVETTRSNGAAKCPFVQPRTVHRLLLVALLTASRAVSPSDTVQLENVYDSLGIPPAQLEQVLHQFQNALGDYGLYVDPVQLEQWMKKWQARFERTQPRQHA